MIDLYFRDHLVYKELRLPLILGRSPKYGSYVHQCNGGREENPNLLRSKGQGQKSPNQFFFGAKMPYNNPSRAKKFSKRGG